MCVLQARTSQLFEAVCPHHDGWSLFARFAPPLPPTTLVMPDK